jgi:hypothetical protein
MRGGGRGGRPAPPRPGPLGPPERVQAPHGIPTPEIGADGTSPRVGDTVDVATGSDARTIGDVPLAPLDPAPGPRPGGTP